MDPEETEEPVVGSRLDPALVVRLARTGLLVYLFLLYYLLLTPDPVPGRVPPFRGLDLVVHVGLFFVLGVLVWFVLVRLPHAWRIRGVLLVGFLLGVLSEWGQGQVAGRSPDLGDLAADLVGTGAVVFLFAGSWRWFVGSGQETS